VQLFVKVEIPEQLILDEPAAEVSAELLTLICWLDRQDCENAGRCLLGGGREGIEGGPSVIAIVVNGSSVNDRIPLNSQKY